MMKRNPNITQCQGTGMLVFVITGISYIWVLFHDILLQLKAWGHNHSMSIFRPFFIFSRSDGQFVAIFPSNCPMTPRSASIHAWALNPARKKKKKNPNFIPSKSLHFFAKSQPFGFGAISLTALLGSTPGPPLPAYSLSLPALPNFGQPTRIHCELPKAVFQAPEHA